MRILYDNHVFDATIDSLTENPEVLFSTGLNDTNLSRKGRTLAVSAQVLKSSFTGAVTASYVSILGENLTDSATVTLEGNATDVWTAPSLSETVTKTNGVWIADFTEASYQYWRVTIDDPANTDGYLEIGYVYLGTYLTMPGMDRGQVIRNESTSTAQTSVSGQVFGDRRLQYKEAEFIFQDVSETERADIRTFFNTVDIVRPFILLIWEDDLDVEPPIYCALTEPIEWARMPYDGLLWTMTLNFKEAF